MLISHVTSDMVKDDVMCGAIGPWELYFQSYRSNILIFFFYYLACFCCHEKIKTARSHFVLSYLDSSLWLCLHSYYFGFSLYGFSSEVLILIFVDTDIGFEMRKSKDKEIYS